MNIYNKITEKKNDIIRKLGVLELDSRFKELVDILKQKEIALEEKFLNIPEKTEITWREYYAELCLFLEQDVKLVDNLYNRHKDDWLSIYDDSSKEINQAILSKEQEIKKCIQDIEKTYHDETLTNYINTKYKLVMEKFQRDLEDVIERNRIAIKNQLTNNYQEDMTLTTYSSCTLVKQRCLDELVAVLDVFINYVNSLIENKRLISEQETLIKDRLTKIDNEKLLYEFITMTTSYYESINNIASIDTRIGMLQKNYFEELKRFYEKVQEEEKKYNLEIRIAGFNSYLTNTNPYEIKFTELAEIKKYLDTANDPELYQLLCQAYYKVIKLELYHNNGKSLVYGKLPEKIKLVIERLYLNEVKVHKEELLKNNCYEEFLTTEFSLELLTKFVKLDLEYFEQRRSDYKLALAHYFRNLKNNKSPETTIIDYECLRESKQFDDNGEVLIKAGKYYYVANRNGEVKKVALYKSSYSESHCYENLKYSNGILMYEYRCGDSKINDDDDNFKFHIIADSEKMIGDDVCAILPYGTYQRGTLLIKDFEEYSDGLIKVTNKLDDNYYFIDKTGKICLTIKNKDWISDGFSDGYILVVTKRKHDEFYEYLDKNGKRCFALTSKYMKYLEDVEYVEDKSKIEYCLSSFKNGYARIEHIFDSQETMLIDTNFKRVFQDYELKIIKRIVVSNFGDRSYNIFCLKSKKDGLTYRLAKNGELVPTTEDELEKYFLVDHYVLVKDAEGNLSFVEGEQHKINCVFDIVGDNDKELLVDSTKKNGRIKYFI